MSRKNKNRRYKILCFYKGKLLIKLVKGQKFIWNGRECAVHKSYFGDYIITDLKSGLQVINCQKKNEIQDFLKAKTSKADQEIKKPLFAEEIRLFNHLKYINKGVFQKEKLKHIFLTDFMKKQDEYPCLIAEFENEGVARNTLQS